MGTMPCVPVSPELANAIPVARGNVSHRYTVGDLIEVDSVGSDFVDRRLGLILHDLRANLDYVLLS